MTVPVTPDGRYFVVRGRLWRCANPNLKGAQRAAFVTELTSARRAKQAALRTGDVAAREVARARVDAAKIALGERGPVWWNAARCYVPHQAEEHSPAGHQLSLTQRQGA